ncbi:tyrosine-type recombinase/integrase [Candidatus Zixiibacteriota bacterium]
MKMKTAIGRFDRQLAADGRSVNTRAAYRRDLRNLAQWFGNQCVSRVKPDDLARFLTSDQILLRPDGLPRKPISVNRTKSALRSFFTFCVNSGWIKENPARLIRSSPASPKEPAILEDSEIRRLRRVLAEGGGLLAERDRLIFELLIGTGIRLGSLVGLNVGDVDLRTGTLSIQLKGGTEGRVFLNPDLRRHLRRFLKENATRGGCGPYTPLFQAQSGKRLGRRQIQLRFARWFDEAGIGRPVSLHSLRHTFATQLYEKTGDLHLVQRALGHRQITTTEVYARVGDGALRRAVASA